MAIVLCFLLIPLFMGIAWLIVHFQETYQKKKWWDEAVIWKEQIKEFNKRSTDFKRVDTTFGEIGTRPKSILDKILKRPTIIY